MLFKKTNKKDKIEDWVKDAIKKKYTPIKIRELLKKKDFKDEHVEKILNTFETVKEDKAIELAKKPAFFETTTKRVKGEVLDKYQIVIDKAKVDISIEKTDVGKIYVVALPEIKIGTKALLDDIRKDLINVTTIGVGEIIDQKSVARIKKKFMIDASTLIREKVPGIKQDTEDFLVGILMQEMLGLGKIEFLL